jgi:hypothetical protein
MSQIVECGGMIWKSGLFLRYLISVLSEQPWQKKVTVQVYFIEF